MRTTETITQPDFGLQKLIESGRFDNMRVTRTGLNAFSIGFKDVNDMPVGASVSLDEQGYSRLHIVSMQKTLRVALDIYGRPIDEDGNEEANYTLLPDEQYFVSKTASGLELFLTAYRPHRRAILDISDDQRGIQIVNTIVPDDEKTKAGASTVIARHELGGTYAFIHKALQNHLRTFGSDGKDPLE